MAAEWEYWRRTGQKTGGVPLEREFRLLFGATGSWFDTDRATIDQNTGKLGAFVDYIDPTHRLEQASSAAQCAPVAPLGEAFNGRPVATAAGAQWYASTRAASAWSYLHNGTGGAAVIVGAYASSASATEMWFATTGAVGDDPGLAFGRGAGGTELLRIGRVGGNSFAYAWQPAPILATPSAWLMSHTNTPTPEIYGSLTGRTGLSATAYTVSPPSSASATTTLSLFARNPAAPSAYVNGSFVAAYFFPRHLSAVDREVIAQWVAQRYGVALA